MVRGQGFGEEANGQLCGAREGCGVEGEGCEYVAVNCESEERVEAEG